MLIFFTLQKTGLNSDLGSRILQGVGQAVLEFLVGCVTLLSVYAAFTLTYGQCVHRGHILHSRGANSISTSDTAQWPLTSPTSAESLLPFVSGRQNVSADVEILTCISLREPGVIGRYQYYSVSTRLSSSIERGCSSRIVFP